jgi:hypothetical protein
MTLFDASPQRTNSNAKRGFREPCVGPFDTPPKAAREDHGRRLQTARVF